uniref:non-specific serine/threonine protein kinase n=1 Tax=Panagrellus redivivus TaxID=6233 RepID=A0A7E4UM48_PANRE
MMATPPGPGTAGGPQQVAPPCLPPHTRLFDRFEANELIGQGGFGQIYKGVDRKTNRPVAIKVEPMWTPGDQLNDPRRIVIENFVLVQLRGRRHIPVVYASGRAYNGCAFIVMQYLGDNLTTLRKMRPMQKFTQSTAFRAGQQVTLALEHLHTIGFIHRDIKPSNCCVGLGKDIKTVYLVDFGMCRRWQISGRARPPRAKAPFRGTIRYASFRAMGQQECGPADDLVGWMFSIIELYLSQLPWAKAGDGFQVAKQKAETSTADLCAAMPPAFQEIYDYLNEVPAEVMPDYLRVYRVLKACLPPGCQMTDKFDWE